MSQCLQLTERELDLIASQALGILAEQEGETFRAHLKTCEACRDQLRQFEQVVVTLGERLPEASLDPHFEERLLQRIRRTESHPSQVWKSWPDQEPGSELAIIRGNTTTWADTPFPGIFVKRLFVDQAANRCTMLIRMEPGSSYPPHRHGGVEECYVIEGDIQVAGQEMNKGDYQMAPAESIHGTQSTKNGCLLLIHSALNDQLLPA